MYYTFLKQITVLSFGKNELGIYVTYLLNGKEKNYACPAADADDILLDATGENFSDEQVFSQYDAIRVAANHEDRLAVQGYVNQIFMCNNVKS